MKRSLFAVIAFMFICLSIYTIWSTIELTRARRARVVALQADFLSSFSVAEELRRGNTQDALFRAEAHTYSAAVQLLGIPGEKSRILQSSIDKIRTYRSKYATNMSSWTVVEQQLEQILNSQGKAPGPLR